LTISFLCIAPYLSFCHDSRNATVTLYFGRTLVESADEALKAETALSSSVLVVFRLILWLLPC